MSNQTQALTGVNPLIAQPGPRSGWGTRSASKAELSTEWTGSEKLIFRFVFLYFLIQALPIDIQFFQNLVDFKGGYTRYLFNLSHYAPRFFGPVDTFANWGVVVLLAAIGTVIWSRRSDATTNYDRLYYWLRVVLRYRLALAVLAYAFIKLFPLQAPKPSISNLNTAYGDFTAWKLFSLSLGVVPSYESFLGLVELVGGLLLLHRKTATIGTLILLPFLGNIFFSNLAYEGGEYVYAGLLTTFGLVLFSFDAIRLFRLVSLEIPASPNRFQLVLSEQWQRTGRLALKSAFLVFVVLIYGFTTYRTYKNGPVRFPETKGLSDVAGIYNVSEFRSDGKSIPYSKTDPNRWKDVVFETWNTISIKSNRPVKLVNTNTEELPATDEQRDYELAGSQGRHYYRYTIDPTGKKLTLTNANPNYADETLQLTYSRPTPNQIILSGTDEKHDSVYAVLDKVAKKYLIDEAAKAGRRGALSL
ncbi:DoxX family protein [Spirosoma profusum]|uniref:DoxX family protein n=1 Tax=Spirosoma profusum TaxID=2771354 RepID=UPI001CC252F8|nr:DoxX family protein [Spirosoma profusum]